MEDGTGGAPSGGLAVRNALYRKMAIHFGELRLIPAIESPRQLEEVMVDFWFNHFNVVAGKGLDHVLIADYERRAIRPHVMGRFRDLLGATAKHPAMLFYLDNWLSVSPTAGAGIPVVPNDEVGNGRRCRALEEQPQFRVKPFATCRREDVKVQKSRHDPVSESAAPRS